MTKHQIIRALLYDICFATGYAFFLSSLLGWFVPSPFLSFLFILLSASLFILHIRVDEQNQKKEMVMLFVVVYLAMIVLYGMFAYFRAKSNYKKVRGNQNGVLANVSVSRWILTRRMYSFRWDLSMRVRGSIEGVSPTFQKFCMISSLRKILLL
ncbi:hypothetical protein JOC78_002938 [Bacillus ectoiniformans]|nr:hypothetical protein [Bacillus ectoiniformans]